MRKKYENPEFEFVNIQLSDELLGSSFTPEESLKEDGDEVTP